MNPAEYANLEAVEAKHWYYVGKREVVRHWLTTVRPPTADDTLLDCGAGTGLFAEQMAEQCRVLVLDSHEESLRILRRRFAPEQVLTLAGDRIPLADGSVSYVTALDVLEHVRDDAGAVAEFQRVVKPGGLVVVTVPAGQALWSDWDVALHHFRRYHRRQLSALFRGPEWEIVHVNYTNVLIHPLVLLVRKSRVWRGKIMERAVDERWEDRLPPEWLNRGLRAAFVGMGHSRIPFPFGVSLLLVARRRAPLIA